MRARTTTLALTAGATALATAFGIGAAHATSNNAASNYPATATLSKGTISVSINNATPEASAYCRVKVYASSDAASVTTFATNWNATTDGNFPDPSTLGTPLGADEGWVAALGANAGTFTVTPSTTASEYSVLAYCAGADYTGATATLAGSSGSWGSLDWTGSTGGDSGSNGGTGGSNIQPG